MTAFGLAVRRGPIRFLFALAALVLTVLGGAVTVPLAAAASPFVMLAAPQQLTWDSLPPDPLLSAGTVSVSATADSGLTVTYTSLTTGVCTVMGSTVTLVAKGTCTIRADQAGNGSYDAATAITDSFEVLGAPQTITWTPTPDQALTGGTVQVAATATSGLTVTYTSATTQVCTVAGDMVTFVTGGTCTIHANQAGNASTAAAPQADDAFDIAKTAQTISFTGPADRAFASGPVTVAATATSGLTVAFTSATTGICTVAGTQVTPVAGGTCTIHADQAGNGTYAAAPRVDRSFDITKTAQTITFTAPADRPMTLTPFAVTATTTSGLIVAVTSASSGVCTVTAGQVTLVGVGTCTLHADQAGNGEFAAGTQVERTFVVSKGTQTITFTPPAGTPLSTGTVPVTPTTTSGLTVAVTSADTAVCTVAGTTVTLVTAGDCVLRGNQAGNADWNAAAQVEIQFTVTKTAQTITFTPPATTALSAGPVTVSATSTSGLTVAFASTTMSVCTVTGTSVTLLTTGQCTIRATQAGNGTYAAATQVDGTFTVAGNAQTITFTQPNAAALSAGTVPLTATATSSLPVAFTSTTTAVCTVTGSTVTLVTAGQCTINANQAGNGSFAPAPAVQRTFTVNPGTQTITFAAPADRAMTLTPFAVTATATSGLTVAFTSASTGVCTVTGTQVTLVGVGTCILHADQAGNPGFAAAPQVERTFVVSKGNQTITLTPPAPTALSAGQVTVTPTSTSGLQVALTSASTGVCTAAGTTVTLVTGGTCILRGNQAGTADWNAATQVETQFEITKGTQTITFTAPPATQLSAGTVAVSATATSGLPVMFASTTAAVCTVTGDLVTLVTTGVCTIRATQAGNGSYTAATQVDGTFNVTGAGQTITFAQPNSVALSAGTVPLTATASSALPVSFTSSTQAVCTVAEGTVTLLTTGQCTVVADQPGNTGFAAAPAVQRTFSVTAGVQTITFTQPANRSFADGPLTVAPSASSGLQVALTSATAAVCTVAGYVVTPVKAGDCILHADQAGTANWTAATRVSRTVTIAPAAQTVTFTAPAATAVSAGPVTLTATAASGLPVTFGTTSTGICTLNGATVTLVAVGACVLTADQTGDDRYAAAATVTGTLTVIQDPVPVTVPADAPPAADAPLTNAAGSSAAPGATITLSGSGYKPNTSITVVVYSTPIPLGTTVTDGAGAFSLQVMVPADLDTGNHTLVAAGLGSDNTLRYLTTAVAVAADPGTLPVTGPVTGTITALGTWAVLIGTVLTLLGKRGWHPRRSRWVYRWTYRGRHSLAY